MSALGNRMGAARDGFRRRLEAQGRRIAEGSVGQWYAGLGPRDRNAVLVLGAFLALVLLWFLLWRPAHDFAERSRLRLQGESAALEWMQANAGRVDGASDVAAGIGGGGSLLSVASASARRFGISLNRFQPEGERGISITLEDVAFDPLVQWLDLLRRDHGVTAAQISVERAESPGRVDVRLLLRQS